MGLIKGPVRIQSLYPKLPVEAFDEGVICQFEGPRFEVLSFGKRKIGLYIKSYNLSLLSLQEYINDKIFNKTLKPRKRKPVKSTTPYNKSNVCQINQLSRLM